MNNGTLDICVGAHYRTNVTLTCANPQLAGVIWTSSDPTILDFDVNGWLIAKAPGTIRATCTAWDGSGLTLYRSFNVHEKVAVYMSPFIIEINTRAFANCEFDEINLLACEHLLSIGSGAFANCDNLNAIYIGDSVTSIATDAFSGCKQLFIHCFEGSAAYTFAVANGIEYFLLQR